MNGEGDTAVTEQERFDRAINKIYGKPVTTESVAVENYNDNATIDEAYRIKDDGNYLVKATGKGGYDNGTVTCWVVVNVDGGSIKGIDKVVIDSNKSQSYIGNISDRFLASFSEYDGTPFNAYSGMIKTGATMSANAICNAVNAAIDYVNSKWLGNVTTEGEKLMTLLSSIYGDKEISVYGVDENGNEKLIEAIDETVTSFVSTPVTVGKSTVNSLYKVRYNDGTNDVLNYVVSSTGTGGFSDGTVTTLTAFNVENGAISSIYKVTIIGNVGQSYIGNINHLDKYPEADFSQGIEFGKDNGYFTSGATLSSTAINNAINGATRYIEENIGNL